ncbi:hypothetical protein JL108_14455 [Aeromicrobium sp. YIM 150415]|uniref:hypothetical protein n=1 Tax=Aeromicrobium sp. YIM 150415 TaxID=2803912 RepID=UPI001962B5C0|nr:hypothetical protein [Aeromicrobium sp. YIM 150415]MBM9464655.1 hypothetical protein [Aeromicrobium sp. YIM 150415]
MDFCDEAGVGVLALGGVVLGAVIAGIFSLLNNRAADRRSNEQWRKNRVLEFAQRVAALGSEGHAAALTGQISTYELGESQLGTLPASWEGDMQAAISGLRMLASPEIAASAEVYRSAVENIVTDPSHAHMSTLPELRDEFLDEVSKSL